MEKINIILKFKDPNRFFGKNTSNIIEEFTVDKKYVGNLEVLKKIILKTFQCLYLNLDLKTLEDIDIEVKN